MTAPTLTDTSHINTATTAGLLGCSRQHVLVLAARGLLEPVTMAGRVFFERAEVEALRDRLAAERTAKVQATKRARSRS